MQAAVYAKLFDASRGDNLHRLVDNVVAYVIVLNVAAIALEQVPAIHEPWARWFHVFDVASLALFTAEYLLRLWVAPLDPAFAHARHPRLKYATSLYALIDLLAILPFYLSAFVDLDLRLLRVLRVLRLLKLLRLLVPAYREFRELNRGRSFRQHVHALVWPSKHGGRLHQFFDTFIVGCVLVSVLGVVLESVEGIHYHLSVEFVVLDTISVAIFALEYLLRIFSCVEDPRFRRALAGRMRYMVTAGAIIDLAAILPFLLEALLHQLFDLRFLRVFRMMRLLKLTRFNNATAVVIQGIRREWPVLTASFFVLLLITVMTASLGYLFEHAAQPEKFENIPQSVYWAVVTLAGVGYGDMTPVTPLGRLFTVVMAITGIALVAIPSGILSAAFIDQLRIERETLLADLREVLSDGAIDEKEREFINAEARRLHVTNDEVARLIERVERERKSASSGSGMIQLDAAGRDPRAAAEQFRMLASMMRQLALAAGPERLAAEMSRHDATTPLERELGRLVCAVDAAERRDADGRD
jgi:voltage-gated potassium channel Kch